MKKVINMTTKTPSNHYFQIGEVAKALGISRRMILNYEVQNVLTPDYIDKKSGYRYYTADNIVHIRIIRLLQNLGLSLAEIRDYFENTDKLSEQIDRLTMLRNELEGYITQLTLRKKQVVLEIHRVTILSFKAYCCDFNNEDLAAKTASLRNTFINATMLYSLDHNNKNCMQISRHSYQSGIHMIPVVNDSQGEKIKKIDQIDGFCIYYRGPYEKFSLVYEQLLDYANKNNCDCADYFLNIFMEGPPTHGEHKEAYITQIVLPIVQEVRDISAAAF